jgi:hypothetical protein
MIMEIRGNEKMIKKQSNNLEYLTNNGSSYDEYGHSGEVRPWFKNFLITLGVGGLLFLGGRYLVNQPGTADKVVHKIEETSKKPNSNGGKKGLDIILKEEFSDKDIQSIADTSLPNARLEYNAEYGNGNYGDGFSINVISKKGKNTNEGFSILKYVKKVDDFNGASDINTHTTETGYFVLPLNTEINQQSIRKAKLVLYTKKTVLSYHFGDKIVSTLEEYTAESKTVTTDETREEYVYKEGKNWGTYRSLETVTQPTKKISISKDTKNLAPSDAETIRSLPQYLNKRKSGFASLLRKNMHELVEDVKRNPNGITREEITNGKFNYKYVHGSNPNVVFYENPGTNYLHSISSILEGKYSVFR